MKRFFDSEDCVKNCLESIHEHVCPHCGAKATLARHGYIRGYTGIRFGIRGWRVFCDPDSTRGSGCGRTVTLRLSGTLPDRCVDAAALDRFILGLLAGVSVQRAWLGARTGMSERTGYRIFRSLAVRQNLISETSKEIIEAHGLNTISRYQEKWQCAFL